MRKPRWLLWTAMLGMSALTMLACDDESGTAKTEDISIDTGSDAIGGDGTTLCGNGVLDSGEACDPGIASGNGACPTTCDSSEPCVSLTLTGDASMCTAECVSEAITSCAPADGCCPENCNANNDNDCVVECGNSVVEGSEECDGDCPVTVADCSDNRACTEDVITGSATNCDAVCSNPTIVECIDDDGCCLAACDASRDNDCSDTCGNGAIDTGETCDPGIAAGDTGACPTACDDSRACTNDTTIGDPGNCDVECSSVAITNCVDDDECCPGGCNSQLDNDCTGTCNNGVVEDGETCDGNCPSTCNDGNACTTDSITGSATSCDVVCTFDPVTTCADGDGCCPAGCNTTDDSDCSITCGNGATEFGETCDGDCPDTCDDSNACTNDILTGSAENCNVSCTTELVTSCVDDDGCCPAGCNAGNDNDCSPSCGDNNVDAGETCDGDCPTTCDDGNSCTNDITTGSAGNCNVVCTTQDITQCVNGDGCCAPGCDSTVDDDCTGDKALGESCNSSGECLLGACITEDNAGWPGGYCSGGCTDDADCGGTGHCAFDAADGEGVCVLDCTQDSDCRTSENYGCGDSDTDGIDECIPVANGSGAPGDACEFATDCAGGTAGWCLVENRGFQDGFCTQECTTSNPCPSGSHCTFIDTTTGLGACFPDCTGDSDCRAEGYLCFDGDDDAATECMPAATGTGDVGDVCGQDFDCAGGEDGFCIEEGTNASWRQGYCSQICDSTTTCPSGSHCGLIDTTTGEGFCLEDCAGNSQCRADGYACRDVDEDNTDECFVSATGTGLTGSRCRGRWDCAGGEFGFCIPEWPGGYCLVECAPNTGTCTSNTECVEFSDGSEFCLASCGDVSDCRTGYQCADGNNNSSLECFP